MLLNEAFIAAFTLIFIFIFSAPNLAAILVIPISDPALHKTVYIFKERE